MSFLFVCCFRPFLRDRTEAREYYELLGVSHDATTEEVKRAYKKKSLTLHPDKLAQRGETLTPEAQAKFQRMKEGYEVLCDPRKRRLYDDLGETGLRIVENPQAVDMQVLGQNFLRSSVMDRCALFSVVLGITAFILLWPVLLCLQADKTINIPWTALWTPLWVCDAFILFVYIIAVSLGRRQPPEGLEDEWHDDFVDRVLALLQFCCAVLFQIFLTLKLDHVVSWSWAKVFAPWFAWEAFQLVHNLRAGCQRGPTIADLTAGMDEDAFLMKRLEIDGARTGVVNGVLRVIFVVLAVLKLDGTLHSSWWAIFTPLWVYFGLWLCSICKDYTLAQARLAQLSRPDIEAAAQDGPTAQMREEAEMIASRSCFGCCTSLFFLTIALLLVARIQSAHYSVFIIFIPLFIVVGCLTCVMGLGICCVSDPGTMDGEGTPLNPAPKPNPHYEAPQPPVDAPHNAGGSPTRVGGGVGATAEGQIAAGTTSPASRGSALTSSSTATPVAEHGQGTAATGNTGVATEDVALTVEGTEGQREENLGGLD